MDYEHYKRLIEILKNGKPNTVLFYRDDFLFAIETLLLERDAAIEDMQRECINCAHAESNNSNHTPCEFIEFCCFAEYWKWRGPKKGENCNG